MERMIRPEVSCAPFFAVLNGKAALKNKGNVGRPLSRMQITETALKKKQDFSAVMCSAVSHETQKIETRKAQAYLNF